MQIHELMSNQVKTISPDASIMEAAGRMAEFDLGFLPVADQERLVGTLTDRDITICGVAAGKSSDTPVSDVMNKDIKYCFDDQDIEQVAANMGDLQIRRMPVVDRSKKLVGIIALADIANDGQHHFASADTLSEVTQRGGAHNQASMNA